MLGYEEYLRKHGFSDESIQVTRAVLGSKPHCTNRDSTYYLARSTIHGVGCFASSCIPVTGYVGEACKASGRKRRALASYLNHSDEPNCKAILCEGWIMVIAVKEIAEGDELLIDYNQVLEVMREAAG